MSNRRILFVGGGSGGHFYPLIAIAEQLNALADPPRLYYAGPEPYDAESLQKEAMTFVRISAGKSRRYRSLLNFFDIFKTCFGTLSAVLKLFVIYPDVVVSKGGYASVPVVLAAAFLRIPIIVHESDSRMGKANAIGSTFARYVVTTYPTTDMPPTKAQVVSLGIPVRAAFLSRPRADAIQRLKIDPDRPVLFVLGGSQGAERINRLVLDSLDELLSDFSIIHQTGRQHIELCTLSAENLIPDTERRTHYHPIAFLDGELLNDAYHVAHIVISRAGSNSIYEISLHGKPSILIPIPEDVSHDQRSNAYAYARGGGATVMEETNLTDDLLRAEIDRIMQNESIYTSMANAAASFAKSDAALRMRELITTVAAEH